MAAASIASWKRSESWARAADRPSLAVTCAGMSRHQITVSSGSAARLHEAGQRRDEVAVAGPPLLVLEPEPLCGSACSRTQIAVLRLCEVQKTAVVPEVLLEQLGVPVETEPADDDRVEVPRQEVGEVEGRRLGIVELLPGGVPGQKPVAVRAGEPLDAVPLEHLVELASGSAVGVGDEHASIPAAQLAELRVHSGGDLLRARVQLRRQAADRDVRPAVQADDREDVPCNCAAREHEHLGVLGLEDALLVRLEL